MSVYFCYFCCCTFYINVISQLVSENPNHTVFSALSLQAALSPRWHNG